MITMPEDVLQANEGEVGFSWDGTSPHPVYADATVKNKDTTMNWAEHQRIVCSAGKLLTSWTADEHTGKGKKAFRALKDAYDGSNKQRAVLRVSKGIHQPETNPHLQLRVVETFFNNEDNTSRSVNYTFHLDVSATEITSPGLVDRFQWDGVRFSYEDENNWYRWPVLAVPPRAKNSSASRRASISYASLQTHLNDLAEQEKKRLRQEALDQQKLQAQTLEAKINQELVRLKQEEQVELRRRNNEPSPKFFKGTTKAYVVNKYSKGYYVIWDEKTQKLIKTI
ncbi:hypothetical protein G3N95_32815 [Paraburkholderia sp. Tr-20389]|uniref:hypothetical protein n=1 Tax=Paraburkholderia sp. Tr-20389 TaxID=2703903 RepID=UPI00197D049D|nr:hypothetical protein [Paraburkholderia sp. Tr-20389]MBN3757745.1 hypothetical protein [Paraburkholderia sp. Tr-20389]